jgi:hypothetical protein
LLSVLKWPLPWEIHNLSLVDAKNVIPLGLVLCWYVLPRKNAKAAVTLVEIGLCGLS